MKEAVLDRIKVQLVSFIITGISELNKLPLILNMVFLNSTMIGSVVYNGSTVYKNWPELSWFSPISM